MCCAIEMQYRILKSYFLIWKTLVTAVGHNRKNKQEKSERANTNECSTVRRHCYKRETSQTLFDLINTNCSQNIYLPLSIVARASVPESLIYLVIFLAYSMLETQTAVKYAENNCLITQKLSPLKILAFHNRNNSSV